MGEATLKSKSMYKATLYTLKILPMVMAFSYLMITVCAHLQVPWQLSNSAICILHYGVTAIFIIVAYCMYIKKYNCKNHDNSKENDSTNI